MQLLEPAASFSRAVCGEALNLSFFTAEKLNLFFKSLFFVNIKWKVKSTRVKGLNCKAVKVNTKPIGPFKSIKAKGKKKAKKKNKLQKLYSGDFTDQDIPHSNNIIKDHFLQV